MKYINNRHEELENHILDLERQRKICMNEGLDNDLYFVESQISRFYMMHLEELKCYRAMIENSIDGI